jgi:predicted RNase H-like nuclease (RuvC/YqgF family)
MTKTWHLLWDNLFGSGIVGSTLHSVIFSYFKSCKYAEKIVKENNESFELRLQQLEEEIKQIKERGQQRITELEKENQELKDLVYNSLDQIHDLKENKSYFAEELQIMKISFDDSLRELEDESLENLGQQIINILDKFNELNEHNKSLSSRVLDVECLLEINTINLKCLLEKKEIPNLIDF